MDPVRILLADDHPFFRNGVRVLLDSIAETEVVGEASTGEDTIEAVSSQRPDLLLLDVSMPRLSGLDALRAIGTSCDAMRTIILSGGMDKSQLLIAIQLGARGVVLKDCATELLFEAMTRVMAGQSWVGQTLVDDLLDVVRSLAHQPPSTARNQPFGLTLREREVLALVVAGCANKEIAQRFAVSEETIKHHLTRMFDKVGAANRLELAMTATRVGLVN